MLLIPATSRVARTAIVPPVLCVPAAICSAPAKAAATRAVKTASRVSVMTEGGLASGAPSIPLTIKSFTNGSGQTSSQPTICGTTQPGAKVTISIVSDGISGEVVADGNGRFCWKPDKPLSAGEKDLLVVATKDDGQGQVTQKFTVITGRGFSWGWIIVILVVVAIIFGGYVYYKSL